MLKLVIANKNYSSWSLRPWLALREAGIPFTEEMVSLNTPEFHATVGRISPAGRVPILIDGARAVWDSLAIIEYAAERFPAHRVWPADVGARAMARSICAEMHGGFNALRSAMPMNCNASLAGFGWSVAVQKDVSRICSMWEGLLAAHGGPFLFGTFSAADAYYAPVVMRLITYAVAVPAAVSEYCDQVVATTGMTEWLAAAALETAFVAEDEPYRLPS